MPNIQPIFSRQADIQPGCVLTTAANDYSGQNVFNQVCFVADPTNGGYVQRLRFKALGACAATVARIYINNGSGVGNSSSNVPQSLTGTPSGTGGNLLTSNLVAKVASVDQFGVPSVWSAESANVAVSSGSGVGSILWNWNASSNSNTYIIAFGKTPGSEERSVTVVGANTYTQTNIPSTFIVQTATNGLTQANNNFLYGEISLPLTAASAVAGTQDIDYPMNLALPPGYKLLIGLGTTVSAGWQCFAIGGKY